MKFEFDTEFQGRILGFLLKDSKGEEVIPLLDHEYFDLIEHAIIFRGVQSFYEKFNKIPDQVFLLDHLRALGKSEEFMDLTMEQDREVRHVVKKIFHEVVRDGDIVYYKIKKFVSYVRMKKTLENLDLTDFESYANFSEKVEQALKVGSIERDRETTHPLILHSKQRQVDRVYQDNIIPTPFRQLNEMTNAGGYSKGSIIVILDKPKNLKTAMLINWSKGYLRHKRNVLYVDLENGAGEILDRLDQSIAGLTRPELTSSEGSRKLDEMTRRYRKLGGEIFVRRLPAYSSSRDIEFLLKEIYKDYGVEISDLVIDYIGKMSSLTKKVDDKERISDAYIDIENLALEYGINHIVTAHHINREGEKREFTRYKDIDIAKCIDIVRHAQVILGLNRTNEEREAGIIRAEIVAQRDGVPSGKALFMGDIPKQSIKEMTEVQRKAYGKVLAESVEKEEAHGDI